MSKHLKDIGDVIGRYRIEEILGEGKEGEVYRVVELKTENMRSLKLLRGRSMSREAESAAAFYRLLRLKAVKRFRHGGFLQGQPSVGNRFYLVFDFVDGVTLECHMTLHRRIPNDFLIKKLCDALAAVHRTGLAIGDFSEGRNILIEHGTQRLIFCDLDYGEVGRPNKDQRTDLLELRKLARQIYRDTFSKPNQAVLTILDQAKTIQAASTMLSTLIFNRKPITSSR